MLLISDLYPVYIKNTYNSIISQTNNKEIGKAYENKHLSKEVHIEKGLILVSIREIPLYIHRITKHKKLMISVVKDVRKLKLIHLSGKCRNFEKYFCSSSNGYT